ncbi:MAG: hypothetical protein LBJ91_03920 [Clostridiales Family XIII bacterium]|jgi:hypothetical protein|nr:hypothetical protein [Clostridiales Family XIII bacterium]
MDKGADSRAKGVSVMIVAVAFVAIIGFMVVATLISTFGPMVETVREPADDGTGVIAQVNVAFEEGIALRDGFIDTFGLVQRAMDKHEVDNYDLVKDMDGYLHRMSYDRSERIEGFLDNATNLYEYTRGEGMDFLLIETSSTYIRGVTKMPPGVDDYSDRNTDLFLAGLDEAKVPYLDVRDLFEGLREDEIRYRTDHHWATPLAFKTFGATADYLNDNYGYDLDPEGVFTDPDNYYVEEHPDSFLGSAGVRVGKYYTGMDDLNIYLPKFETNLRLKKFLRDHELRGEYEGDFRTAFIADEYLEKGHLNKYQTFLQNGYEENFIYNYGNDNGLKCLLITDSFGRSYAQYLSLLFSETVTIDASRESRYDGDVKEYIAAHEPDVVICMVYGRSVWHTLAGF